MQIVTNVTCMKPVQFKSGKRGGLLPSIAVLFSISEIKHVKNDVSDTT